MKDETTCCSDTKMLPVSEVERKQRAAARWKILRSALLGKDTSSIAKNASIHRFAGFQMLSRQIVEIATPSVVDETKETDYAVYDYTIPRRCTNTHHIEEESIKASGALRVRTRERMQNEGQKIDLKALTSHRHFGVDNTGNARVWDSEATLTHCLMQACWDDHKLSAITSKLGLSNLWNLASQNNDDNTLHVVELGAGMAGIAGLSLAATALAGLLDNGIHVDVLLTDGHPDAVKNNIVNAGLTDSLYSGHEGRGNIKSTRLLWKDTQEGADECTDLIANNQRRYFDLCLASDCVHFQEFHAALAMTVARLLRVDGAAIFCQPHRSNSLQRFMKLLDCINKRDTPLWEFSVVDDYDEEMSKRHKQYSEEDLSYDPSIHYPALLLLRKIRELDESLDRETAVRHMVDRDAVKTSTAADDAKVR